MPVLTKHQQAALKIDRHISLTANAGSGKTFVLSKRFLEIALSQKIPNLQNIAAISFTDKAAGELYKKIAVEIDNRLLETTDKIEIRKLENIRRQLVSANISTIHSFCIDILRQHPVEAEIDANFTSIDELTSNELIELSVEELVREYFNNPESAEKLKYLIRILGSKPILSRELISLIKKRKNILALLEKLYSKSIQDIAKYFRNEFKELFNKVFSSRIKQLFSVLNTINSIVLTNNPGNNIAQEVSILLRDINNEIDTDAKIKILIEIGKNILTQKNELKKREYLPGKLWIGIESEIKSINSFYYEISNLVLEEDSNEVELELAQFGSTLLHLFRNALKNYDEKKLENGYLDYEDILLLTQKILENKFVQNALSNKYHFIMVDEYQDTNELQYSIFLPILDNLKKGNLFVVGDEKQSIYKFRDAELEVFSRTKEDINSTGGEDKILTLPESFRMSPSIALFTNELFSKIFADPNPIYNEVTYNELVCASNTETEGAIEFLLVEDETENENYNSINPEAEIISAKITGLVQKGEVGRINFNDIAVLCRKRKEFKDIENTFVKNNIPFIVVGGKGFYQRQAIYDIYNYFSLLFDTDNDTAVIGTLRSPFFNISDSQIFEISLEKGKNFLEKMSVYSAGNPSLNNIVNILNENIRLSISYDITSLLRKMLDESNYLAVIASQSNSRQELANLDKLIKVTANFNRHGLRTLYDYVYFLKDSIARIEDEAQAGVTDQSNAVNIMTYHQAKGLEYKAVFLYKSDETLKKDSIKAKSVSVNKNYGIMTKVPLGNKISSEYRKAPIVGLVDLIEERKELAEFKRLYYVGVTRAIEYLFICGKYKEQGNYADNSILGMTGKALNIDFTLQNFALKSLLKISKEKNGVFKTDIKEIELNIKITHTMPDNNLRIIPVKNEIENFKINISEIHDIPEGEFISATKVAVFEQCPLKYQLTYEYGFTKLFSRYKNWFKSQNSAIITIAGDEFKLNEDLNDDVLDSGSKVRGLSDVKGRIIHKVLQNEISTDNIESFIDENLKNELDSITFDKINYERLKKEILEDLKIYLESATYSKISVSNNFRNEYEVYVKEKDYFLYGIIDKLIIEDNRIKIIDYKTSDISEGEIKGKVETYFPQLQFYSYIVSQLFDKIDVFELVLVFIKHPEKEYMTILNKSEIAQFSKKLQEMIEHVREGKFNKNLNHCSNCLYALQQANCIISN